MSQILVDVQFSPYLGPVIFFFYKIMVGLFVELVLKRVYSLHYSFITSQWNCLQRPTVLIIFCLHVHRNYWYVSGIEPLQYELGSYFRSSLNPHFQKLDGWTLEPEDLLADVRSELWLLLSRFYILEFFHDSIDSLTLS